MKIDKNKLTFRVAGMVCLLAFLTLTTACEQDEPFMDQIAKPTGKGYYPVIASASVDPASTVPAGSDITVDLRYWSLGDIESISLIEVVDADSTEVFTTGYTPAYSMVTRTDSLLIDYSVPPSTASGTTYVVNVTNANALKREQKVLTVE